VPAPELSRFPFSSKLPGGMSAAAVTTVDVAAAGVQSTPGGTGDGAAALLPTTLPSPESSVRAEEKGSGERTMMADEADSHGLGASSMRSPSPPTAPAPVEGTGTSAPDEVMERRRDEDSGGDVTEDDGERAGQRRVGNPSAMSRPPTAPINGEQHEQQPTASPQQSRKPPTRRILSDVPQRASKRARKQRFRYEYATWQAMSSCRSRCCSEVG
jgi:hypothetical protein